MNYSPIEKLVFWKKSKKKNKNPKRIKICYNNINYFIKKNTDLSDDDEDEVILALVESVNLLLDQIPNSHQVLLITAYE